MKYGKIIEGNLKIKKGDKNDYSEVEEIKGYLYIDSNATLESLQTVGSGLYIHSNATLEAKSLQTVGGGLYIDSNATLEAKKAKYNVKEAKKIAFEFNFNCFLKLGFVFADGILAKLITKHTNKNGANVYKVQIVGQKETSYCIEANGVFAHGETIKQAKEDLEYKFQDRDTSMYKNYTLDTVITFKEALQMYHDITGACSGGTKHFVEHVLKVKKKKYTIRECIELTKGQYNSEMFRKFFEK